MKAIVTAFTLKNQPFETILPLLRKLAEENPEVILIHGFMPRRLLEERKWSLDVVNALENLFPVQLNMHDDAKPLREEMALIAKKLSATVYVIGEVKEGVAEEIKLYEANDLLVIHWPILAPAQ